MQRELEYILQKYNIEVTDNLPIEIPDTTRETLAELFKELGYKKGVELGVEAGLYSEVLCQKNPEATLFCIDAWTAYKGYREYVTQEKIDSFYEEAKKRLEPYNALLWKQYSMDAVEQFEDGELDFIFIDGNHSFEHVAQDIGFWARKVRKGGIVSGHDYVARKGPSNHKVIEAVQGYTKAYKINPWFVLGRRERREGERRDKSRSWFFVKE